MEKEFNIRLREHDRQERGHLRHCFSLLLQAFKGSPGKARLFYRLHQYCQLTGYQGLKEIAHWIEELRRERKIVWADYYAALSLQILSSTMLSAWRISTSSKSLHSDRKAARNHLKDVAELTIQNVLRSAQAQILVSGDGPARIWHFQAIAIADVCSSTSIHDIKLSGLFKKLSQRVIPDLFNTSSAKWENATAYSAGVWAHRCEQILGGGSRPQAAWQKRFEPSFDYELTSDRCAVRRYPEFLTDRAWSYLVASSHATTITDSGWVCDALENRADRVPSGGLLAECSLQVRRLTLSNLQLTKALPRGGSGSAKHSIHSIQGAASGPR